MRFYVRKSAVDIVPAGGFLGNKKLALAKIKKARYNRQARLKDKLYLHEMEVENIWHILRESGRRPEHHVTEVCGSFLFRVLLSARSVIRRCFAAQFARTADILTVRLLLQ